ncbi:MAG: hypothetical protein PVJ49_18960 [Acidobacteriota bacterium]|jgi:hypothetical protein
MRQLVASVVAALLCVTSLACNGPPELEFADWVFPVDEGTPVREYAPVPMEEREEDAFELVEDLVIGGDPADPNTSFYRAVGVVAADNGNIFVIDSGNARVQMFGPDGGFLKTLGQRGQGPGEFQMPTTAAMAGDRLVVSDMRNSRFSVWTDEGEHVGEHNTSLGFQAMDMEGLAGGGMMILGPEINIGAVSAGAPPQMTNVLASYSAEGEQRHRFVESGMPPMGNPAELMSDPRNRVQFLIDVGEVPMPRFAVGRNDIVYVTPASEYQVLAMNGDGETVWALRVAWPRPPYPESGKERRVEMFASEDPDLSVDDFEWPEFTNAISSTMLVDGEGRLYVFPYTRGLEENADDQDRQAEDDAPPEDAEEEGPRGSPVDIYSPDGELIVAGLAEGGWQYARGDYVYALRSDPDTDEIVVYRYRLVLNR